MKEDRFLYAHYVGKSSNNPESFEPDRIYKANIVYDVDKSSYVGFVYKKKKYSTYKFHYVF